MSLLNLHLTILYNIIRKIKLHEIADNTIVGLARGHYSESFYLAKSI